MIRAALQRMLLAVALFCVPQLVGAQAPVPALNARVTDLTGTLTPDQRAALEGKLATFEKSKGTQVAVLLVPTTKPEAIEQYSLRVVEQWKLGRKGVDDGALLIVAKNDRRMRIEVGYGLEGVLPDAISRRIIEEAIAPRFRESDFYGGITAGVDRMLRVIEGEALPPPAQARARTADGGGGGWFHFLIPAVILAMVVGGTLRRLFGRMLGSSLVGGAAGLLAWLLIGLGAAVVIGLIAFLFSLFAGGRSLAPRGAWSGSPAWPTRGGWGSGGGGFGGGGFGGGGGGFGGGGASGSW